MTASFEVTHEERRLLVNGAVDEDGKTPREFQCTLCQQLLFLASECKSCGVAAFCGPCVKEYFEQTGVDADAVKEEDGGVSTKSCPACQEKLVVGEWPVRSMGFLNRLEIRCGREDCPQQHQLMRYDQFVEDHDQCIAREVPCPNGCGEALTRQTFLEHLDLCGKKLKYCKLCSRIHRREEQEAHDLDCPGLLKSCNECGHSPKPARLSLQPSVVDSYCQYDARDAQVQPPACQIHFRRRAPEAEEPDPEEEIRCDKCKAAYLRKDSTLHDCWEEVMRLISRLQTENSTLITKVSQLETQTTELKTSIGNCFNENSEHYIEI